MFVIRRKQTQTAAEAVEHDTDKAVQAFQLHGFLFAGEHAEHLTGVGCRVKPIVEQLLTLTRQVGLHK